MKRYISTLMALTLPIVMLSQTPVCDDNVCVIEEHGGEMPVGEIFNVVSPVGRSSVKPIKQAPRLTSLDGKTIAIVGGSFMASVTHRELKRLIQKEYPTAKVYMLSEIGSAGVFPWPGIRRMKMRLPATESAGHSIT